MKTRMKKLWNKLYNSGIYVGDIGRYHVYIYRDWCWPVKTDGYIHIGFFTFARDGTGDFNPWA